MSYNLTSCPESIHGFGQSSKIVVHRLLIRGMTCHSHNNEFPMVSALLYDAH